MVSLQLIDIIGWKMRKGGIEPPENEVEGLEEYVSYYYNLA